MNSSQEIKDLSKQNILKILSYFRGIIDVNLRRLTISQVRDLRYIEWIKQYAFRIEKAEFLCSIHDRLKDNIKQLIKTSSQGHINQQQFQSFYDYLTFHHMMEDQQFFPVLRSNHPELNEELDILELQHKHFQPLAKQIAEGDYQALIELNSSLQEHLDQEELICIPYLMDGTSGY